MNGQILHAPVILELGPEFYDEVDAAKFPTLKLRYRNQAAARTVGLDGLSDERWVAHFGRFEPFPGNLARPLALRYHGHQFRHYNPDLGDGRGFLQAQFVSDGIVYDLGTKGSGKTPYSRGGDGRLTLKGAVREALATEMLESLGVNTSKTLSFIETGESLVRHDEPSPTRAAVLVRLSEGHIRIGTFQRLAYFDEVANIKKLTDYCLRHYYPTVRRSGAGSSEVRAANGTSTGNGIHGASGDATGDGARGASGDATNDAAVGASADDGARFFQAVTLRTARLAAEWMIAGFVHGVLNSDNINISGESFDYGPYRFLPNYDPTFTAAYFDQQGLYSYGRQPITMVWNLEQLAESLLKAYPDLPVDDILMTFGDEFNTATKTLFFRRLNLRARVDAEDDALMTEFFRFLEKNRAPFEQTFFDLYGGVNEARLQRSPQKDVYASAAFSALRAELQKFTPDNEAKLSHPYFANAKPCTLLIDEIEEIWAPIAAADDWSRFEAKLSEIRAFREVYTS
jgi:uncharacterized protein YdiU (UPF0061 family)